MQGALAGRTLLAALGTMNVSEGLTIAATIAAATRSAISTAEAAAATTGALRSLVDANGTAVEPGAG